MAGAIDKKINDIVDELEGSPINHVAARASILGSITLSREFAQTYLNALCEKYNSTSGNYSHHYRLSKSQMLGWLFLYMPRKGLRWLSPH